MFGQSGGGSGPWQGQNNNNMMDAETLAQTLVSVAQNLLSSQNQNAHPSPAYPSSRGRPSPWESSSNYSAQHSRDKVGNDHNDYSDHPQPRGHSYGSQSSRPSPKPLMGMGLLGAPPDGDYRTVREPVFVISDQGVQGWRDESCNSQEAGSGRGFQTGGFEEENFVEKVSSRGDSFGTEKSRKNYRPKIKENGSPPKYAMGEFEHLNRQYFCCGMCGKNMWNALSFVNHIKGNAHNKVVENATAMEVSKIAAVKKEITELMNKDSGKPKPGEKSGKCNMCGGRVKGDLVAHRKTDYHKKLKTFIHPYCKVCDADFEDRGEWHYHKFSSEHLENLEGSIEGLEYDPMSSDELDKLLKQLEKRNGHRNTGGGEKPAQNVDKNNMFREMKAAASKQSKHNRHVDEDIIIMEDEESVTEKDLEPIMKDSDILGAEFVKPVNGMFCKLCKKFFGAGDFAIAEHCKTQQHLQKYRAQNSQHAQPVKRSSASEFFNVKRKK